MVKNTITGLGETIKNGFQNVLEFLFVPSDNLFDDIQIKFNEKFGFINQVIDIVSNLSDIYFDDGVPSFSIKLYGKECEIIDFSLYHKYKNFIHNITVAIAYFSFFLWLIHEIPCIVGGIVSGQRFTSLNGNRGDIK